MTIRNSKKQINLIKVLEKRENQKKQEKQEISIQHYFNK